MDCEVTDAALEAGLCESALLILCVRAKKQNEAASDSQTKQSLDRGNRSVEKIAGSITSKRLVLVVR